MVLELLHAGIELEATTKVLFLSLTLKVLMWFTNFTVKMRLALFISCYDFLLVLNNTKQLSLLDSQGIAPSNHLFVHRTME